MWRLLLHAVAVSILKVKKVLVKVKEVVTSVSWVLWCIIGILPFGRVIGSLKTA